MKNKEKITVKADKVGSFVGEIGMVFEIDIRGKELIESALNEFWSIRPKEYGELCTYLGIRYVKSLQGK